MCRMRERGVKDAPGFLACATGRMECLLFEMRKAVGDKFWGNVRSSVFDMGILLDINREKCQGGSWNITPVVERRCPSQR